MIECRTVNAAEDHLIVRSTEPCRIEVSVCDGKLILHVYKGAEVDEDQQPAGGYLGVEPGDSWRIEDDGTSNLIDDYPEAEKPTTKPTRRAKAKSR